MKKKRTLEPLQGVARRLREGASLTQEDLALKAGVSKRTIENVEQGVPCLAATAEYIAGALDARVGDLFMINGDLDEYRNQMLRYCNRMTVNLIPRTEPDVSEQFGGDLASLYFPLRLEPYVRKTLNQSDGDGRTQFGLAELLNHNRRLVILGEPGGGKTILLRWLATLLLSRDMKASSYANLPDAQENVPREEWLPILIRCRDLNQIEFDFEKILRQTLSSRLFRQQDIAPLCDSLLLSAAEGKAIILFDGVDEIASLHHRTRLLTLLEEMSLAWPRTPIVMTSRITAYREMSRRLGRGFRTYRIAEVGRESKSHLFQQWCKLTEPEDQRQSVQETLESLIDNDPRISRITDNPLLLVTLAHVKPTTGKAPRNSADLIGPLIELLLRRKPVEELDIREAVPQLAYLAYFMCHNDRSYLDEEEIIEVLETMRVEYPNMIDIKNREPHEFLRIIAERTNVLIERPYDVGLNIRKSYEFWHPVFQEYLASQALIERMIPSVLWSGETNDVRNQLEVLAGETEQHKNFKDLEYVVTEKWREVIRLCLATSRSFECESYLKALLESTNDKDPTATRRPRAVLAASCLADTANVSEDAAKSVLEAFTAEIRIWDGQGAVRTGTDFAALELASSRWSDLTMRFLLERYGQVEPAQRPMVGSVLAMMVSASETKKTDEWYAAFASDICKGHSELSVTKAALVTMYEAYHWRGKSSPDLIAGLMKHCAAGSSALQHATAWSLLWLSGADYECDGIWQPTPQQTDHLARVENNLSDDHAKSMLGIVIDRSRSSSLERPLRSSSSKDFRKRRQAIYAMVQRMPSARDKSRAQYIAAISSAIHDPINEVREAAIGALATIKLTKPERQFVSVDADGRWPWIDPEILVDTERLEKLAGKLGIHVDDVRERLEPLVEQMDLKIVNKV